MESNQKKTEKILYIITKSNWGGAQRYVYDLAVHASREAFSVSVAAGGDGPLMRKLAESNVRTIHIPHLHRDIGILNELKVFFFLIRLLSKEKPDVIHVNSSKIGGLGALAARITRVPRIIFTSHGWAFNEERAKTTKALIWLLQWISVLLSHKTIVVAQNDLVQSMDMPFVKQKINLIYNGIGLQAFKRKDLARKELVKKDLPQDNALWIGTISELHKNKGLTYLIEALDSLNKKNMLEQVCCVIIGSGEEKERLIALTKEKGLEHVIHFATIEEGASHYLKAFDVFTLTSIKEGFPFVILEAGSAKLPIIASNVGGIPEIIDDMESGVLVRPKDVNELEKALLFLIENPPKRRALGTKLYEKIENQFSEERMLKKTYALYKI